MAYQEYAITTLDDVPALAIAFAVAAGWNANNGGIRHPTINAGSPGGDTYEFVTEENALIKDLICRSQSFAASRQARIRNPVHAQAASPYAGFRLAPTKLFLIGGVNPQPYLAVVVQFGFNLYRHLYLGYVEKQGTYSGGLIVSACNGPMDPDTRDRSYRYWYSNSYLFSAQQQTLGQSKQGGMSVEGDWKEFRAKGAAGGESTMRTGLYDGTEVMGGFNDGIADILVQKARAPLAGAIVLVPCTIYAPRFIGNDYRLRPLGRAAGVRMCSLAELEPEGSSQIASETWHHFAAISKQTDTVNLFPPGGNSRWPFSETSYLLGYAYKG